MFDLDLIKEKYSLQINGIIHVGAFDGKELDTYIKNGAKNIVMFEPLSQNFNTLKHNLKSLNLSDNYNIELHKVALGNTIGKIDINLANSLMSSSILQPKLHLIEHPWCLFDGTENVDINRLDSYEYKNHNFLLMDVQGYELEVLKGAENTLNHIDYIQSEVNKAEVYENNALIEDLDRFLSQYNFERVETIWWPDASWGEAFYIKKKKSANKFVSKNKFSSKKQTLTFRELGGLGRLGNQMFQYASTRGIAANRNFDCAFPLPNENIVLYNCFKNTLKYSSNLPNYDRVSPIGFEFDESLFNQCVGNRDILDYLQTEKYFKHIKEDIKKDFTFDDFIFNSCNTYIKELFPNIEIISLHIRRTDYIKDETMYELPLEYYKNALKMMPDNLPILIFSDDAEWCEDRKLFSDKRFKIIDTNNFFVDLCMMTLCNYHIIANSSFSWWGAWLARSKKVIAPKKWFRNEHNIWSSKDVCCSDWIQI